MQARRKKGRQIDRGGEEKKTRGSQFAQKGMILAILASLSFIL